MYNKYLKVILSFLISVTVLSIFMPILLLISMAIAIDSNGSIFFIQERLGKSSEPFDIYKFRTMIDDRVSCLYTCKSKNDDRITNVGKFLRMTSLDEIPQLFNVMKGDMTIIGPRPILDCEFEPYRVSNQFLKRYVVHPGLFCSVDVKYRAIAPRSVQMGMDVDYVDNITFFNDFTILLGTIKMVLTMKNIYRTKN